MQHVLFQNWFFHRLFTALITFFSVAVSPLAQVIMPGNQRRTEAGEESVTLQRQLNLFDCFSMVVGIIIGSGIFISPKGVLQSSNSVGWFLVIWVFSGIFSCFGALSYVELATSIPLSGGDYTYLRLSFGGLFSFLRIWTIIAAVRTGPLTLLSITAGTYLAGKSAVCSPIAVRLFAACVLCKFSWCDIWNKPYTSGAELRKTNAAMTKKKHRYI